ncbi:hypothetical protein C7388_1131, partial [Methylobacterium radiotolerans]
IGRRGEAFVVVFDLVALMDGDGPALAAPSQAAPSQVAPSQAA